MPTISCSSSESRDLLQLMTAGSRFSGGKRGPCLYVCGKWGKHHGGFGPFMGGCKAYRWGEGPSRWPQQCCGRTSLVGRLHPSCGCRPTSRTAGPAVVANQTCRQSHRVAVSTLTGCSHGARSLPGPLQDQPLRANNDVTIINSSRIMFNMQFRMKRSFACKGLYLVTIMLQHRD